MVGQLSKYESEWSLRDDEWSSEVGVNSAAPGALERCGEERTSCLCH